MSSPQGKALVFSALLSHYLKKKKKSIFLFLSQSLFQLGNHLVALGTHMLLKLILAKVTNEKLFNAMAAVLSLPT